MHVTPAGLVLLGLAATSAAAPAAAPEWRVAAASADPTSIVFVDAASVARSGDTVTFRADTRLREPTPLGRRSIDEQVEAGCESRSWKSRSSFSYRDKGRDMTATDTVTTVAGRGTVREGVIAAACTGRFATGPIPDPARFAAAYFAASGSYREQLEAAARSQGGAAAEQ